MLKSVLITGASGFVGQRYLTFNAEKYKIKTVSLQRTKPENVDFSNIATIVHLAGMAHQMEQIDRQIYFDVNYHLTKRLAENAKKSGVKHFIFISTVKVYGDEPASGYLDLDSPTIPNDPYGESKLKAEQALQDMEDEHFTISIIRPPLVYGPKVKGNLIRLMRLTQKNLPLPFKGINNQRSMVYLDNLIALINKVTDSRTSGIFIPGDKQPFSTSDLLAMMYKGMNRQPFWFKMPALGISVLQKIKPELAKRLYDSFVIDTTETNKKLDFVPPFEAQKGISEMTTWFLKNNA